MSMRWILPSLVLLGAACGSESDPAPGPDAPLSEAGTTWYRDVLPVAQTRCFGCHNDEGATPFSMEQFSPTLQALAPVMKSYTETGVMPPWPPSSACNHYAGERLLTDEEKAVFGAWADGGAVEGDPADAPAPLPIEPGLAWVDLTVAMPAPYTPAPPAGETDDHRCFVLDPGLASDETLIGFDVRPGDARVVHHVLLYLVGEKSVGTAEALDAADPAPGYACPGGTGVMGAAPIAGWVPGGRANTFPDGTGITVGAGSRLLLQLHYNTASAGPQPDQTAVDLQLARAPVSSPAVIGGIADPTFVIPPATSGFATSVDKPVPASARLWGVAPHMHQRGRSIRVDVVRADGTEECVVDVPAWDFDWQGFYYLATPVEVGPGDTTRLRCTWDNPDAVSVTWGEDTSDEMCLSFFYATSP
jgi:hypothetical protein